MGKHDASKNNIATPNQNDDSCTKEINTTVIKMPKNNDDDKRATTNICQDVQDCETFPSTTGIQKNHFVNNISAQSRERESLTCNQNNVSGQDLNRKQTKSIESYFTNDEEAMKRFQLFSG